MKIITTNAGVRRLLDRSPGRIGLVPTMGYLHQGHLSLVKACKRENQTTVVSVFVNPTQFAAGEDLNRYPRDLPRDARLLKKEKVDLLFAPNEKEMYPTGFLTHVRVDRLGEVLCGVSRPGHFQGVATVVAKLLNIVRPDRVYFGQKDAQQAVIISRMVCDLNIHTRIRVLPTVRDADGLALSSRNVYLTPAQRQAALNLPGGLQVAKRLIAGGERRSAAIRRAIAGELDRSPLIRSEYIAVVSLDRLEELDRIDPDNTLVACAIRVGATRLIDNLILGDHSC